MNPQKYPAGVLRGKESKRPSSSLSFANKFTRSSGPHGKNKAQTERLHFSRLLPAGTLCRSKMNARSAWPAQDGSVMYYSSGAV